MVCLPLVKQLMEQQEQLKKLVEQLQIRDNIIEQLKTKIVELEKERQQNNKITEYLENVTSTKSEEQNTIIEIS